MADAVGTLTPLSAVSSIIRRASSRVASTARDTRRMVAAE